MAFDFVADPRKPVRVYVSHSLPDEYDAALVIDRLNRGVPGIDFRAYSDRDLEPGDMREEKRKEWFAEAEIILLLVSSEYVDSEETRREAELAFERRRSGTAIVMPLYLSEEPGKTPFVEVEPLLRRGTTFRNAGPPDAAAEAVVGEFAEFVHRKRARFASPAATAAAPMAEPIGEPVTVSRED